VICTVLDALPTSPLNLRMFGASLSKLLLLVVLVAVVWFGFRYMSRVDAIRRALREELQRRQKPAQKPPTLEA
jgi:hypothetical protein